MLTQNIQNDYSKKWFAFIGIGLLSFGCFLDYTVVNVALPTIQRELQSSLNSLQWVMNIYFLALCVFSTIMGRLGDLFGRKRCFYVGAGIFAIASIMAGYSPTIHWLILGRFFQGIGAAIVFPLGPSLIPDSFPENERTRAIAWLGSMGGIALALGPVLGGTIVTYLGWRWIFFINVPIVAIGYLFCFSSIKESLIKSSHGKLDWTGMILLGFAMSGIVLGLIHSQMLGWFNFLTWLYLAISVMASILLFKIESKQNYPLIDFSDFSNLLFYAGAVLCFLAGVLSAVALFFDPLYLQIIRNQSPQLSGLILFAIPIAVFGVAFIVEWFILRLGIINTILAGIFFAILSSVLHILFISTTPLWLVTIAFIFLGSMWAMGNTVPIIAAQLAVGPHRSSAATGTMVTMFNIGGSIGLSIAVVVYHLLIARSVKHISESKSMQLDTNQTAFLEKLLLNPAHTLQVSMNTTLHSLFNEIFIDGFVGVMWFLLVISTLSFLSIFIWKVLKRERV